MARPQVIRFVEKNIRGAWVVNGLIGSRQYYYYTKAQVMKLYREEYEKEMHIHNLLNS